VKPLHNDHKSRLTSRVAYSAAGLRKILGTSLGLRNATDLPSFSINAMLSPIVVPQTRCGGKRHHGAWPTGCGKISLDWVWSLSGPKALPALAPSSS